MPLLRLAALAGRLNPLPDRLTPRDPKPLYAGSLMPAASIAAAMPADGFSELSLLSSCIIERVPSRSMATWMS